MNRRRGWSHWLLAPVRGLSELFRIFVLVPYYETIRAVQGLGRWFTSGIGVRSWSGILSYYLFWLPRSLWHLIVSLVRVLYTAVVSWPRMMRLRDLATGLPAVIVAVPVILSLTMLRKDRNELTSMYHQGLNESYAAALKVRDPAIQKVEMEHALFYARSLARLDSEDMMYRFNLALLYLGSGDNDRALTMMSELAPRVDTGFGPAHLWMAKQILAKPLPRDNGEPYRAAVAHLKRSLGSDKVDKNEAHRLLGELYFLSYSILKNDGINVLQLSPEAVLGEAKVHFQQCDGKDVNIASKLGRVLALQGNFGEARLVMQNLIDSLRVKVQFNDDDVVARLELARALSVVQEFTQATDVLEKGRIGKPDPRLDHELSNVYFLMSQDIQRKMPSAPALPFQALKNSFELNAGNGLVVARYLQALIRSPAEQLLARESLAGLSEKARSRGITKFMLGFDADHRGAPQLADQHYKASFASNDPETPSVVAEVAEAVIERRYPGMEKNEGVQIMQKGLQIWPTHPDLLVVRAFYYLQTSQYTNALGDLKQAVDAREKDVTLKLRIANESRVYELLAQTYLKLGQRINAEKFHRMAQSAAAKREPLK
ncbi:MAG: hypothetical protein K8U03_26340 [Planctomycetia bacterium]|nr:hypothetical protein [Planctomycetia bacterium]